MKLHAYGDSWTEGEGANWNVESQIKDRQQLQLYRNQHSWVNHLSKKLGLEPVNNLELSILPHKFTESYQFGNDKFNSFLSDYKKFFLLELFNQNYYNIVNQNYIIFLQKMLDEYKINYLMCDGFDLMVQDLDKKNDVTHLINKKKYWGFAEKSIESWMMKNYKNNPVWEVKIPNPIKVAQHPNIEGYKLITEELYNYIVKNELYER